MSIILLLVGEIYSFEYSIVSSSVQVLADALTAREPNLNWFDVVQSLDFPGFVVKDANALKIIVNAVKKALQFCSEHVDCRNNNNICVSFLGIYGENHLFRYEKCCNKYVYSSA